jgi:hypothetical protein
VNLSELVLLSRRLRRPARRSEMINPNPDMYKEVELKKPI